MTASVWDFLNTINTSKDDLIRESEEPELEKQYEPFIINRSLSYFADSIHYAVELNRYSVLSNQMQYDFYRLALPKRKRFSKFAKIDALSADLEMIIADTNYSRSKAIAVLSVLDELTLQKMRDAYFKGGREEKTTAKPKRKKQT